MTKKFYPSMMCAAYGDLAGEIARLEEAGADGLHLDLMDGQFAPNFSMGFQDTAFICKTAKIPCDMHMMCISPSLYIDRVAEMGAQTITIHAEAEVPYLARTLQYIKDKGKRVGLALNPATSLSAVECVLPLVDSLLLMSVNPGYAGQKFLPFVDEKIREAIRWKEKYSYEITMDGSCNPEIIARYSALGVDGFVLGSSLFNVSAPYKETVKTLRG